MALGQIVEKPQGLSGKGRSQEYSMDSLKSLYIKGKLKATSQARSRIFPKKLCFCNSLSLFKVSVLSRYMSTDTIFAFESLFTVGTVVAEVSGEVNALNMVPYIVHVGVLLATKCAGVASLSTFRGGLLQVLVKHRPPASQS